MRSKEPLDDEHRWQHGIFLGICPTTGQYIVHCVERKAIRMARTIRCVPDESKWNAANIESVRVSPFDIHSVGEPGVVFQDRPAQPGDADLPKKTTVRKIYIKGEDIRAFGFTIGCPKCDHDRRYGPGRTTKGHSQVCRERIMGELMKTPEGLRRINAADERGIRNIAEQAEESSQVPPVHGGQGMMHRWYPSLICALKIWTLASVALRPMEVLLRMRSQTFPSSLCPTSPITTTTGKFPVVPMAKKSLAWKWTML